MSKGVSLLIGVGVLTAFFSGCQVEGPGRASSSNVRDSSGVLIAENELDDLSASVPRCETAVVTLAGQALGPAGTELYNVEDAVVLSDGRVVIGNSGTGELKYFSSTGDHLFSIGRKGEGPGEFRAVSTLRRLPGDSVFAYDRWQRRGSVFDPDGALTRTLTFQPHVFAHLPSDVYPLSEGGYLGLSNLSGRKKPIQPPGLFRDTTVVLLYDEAGGMKGVVAKVPGFESYMPEESNGGVSISPAFGRDAFFSPLPNGFLLASSDSLSIRRYDPTGRLEAVFRAVQEPTPISGPILDQAEQALAARRPARTPGWFSGDLLLSTAANPDVLPAFEGLIADSDGAFWVGSPGGGRYQPNVWMGFSPEGTLVYSVEFPAGFRPLSVTDGLVVGRTRDDRDVEFIVVRKIGRCRPS